MSESYSMSTVKHVDGLYDYMPLADIADIVNPSLSTLKNWSKEGLIETDKEWDSIKGGRDTKASVRKAASLKRHGYTYEEISNRLGVCRRTAVSYVKEQADHT